MPTWMTREALTALVVANAPLAGVAQRSVRAPRLRREVTDEDKAMVAERLGPHAAAGRLVPFRISTEGRAFDGHTIRSDGWDLERYSGIVLAQHNEWALPRLADSVVWHNGKDRSLDAVASFFDADLNRRSWELGEIAYHRGHEASVGWEALEAKPAEEAVRKVQPWAMDVLKARLWEWSLVNIGSDAEAHDLRAARADGLETRAIAEDLERRIAEAVSAAVKAQLEELHRAARPEPPAVTLDLGALKGALGQLPSG